MEWGFITWVAIASLGFAALGMSMFPRHREELLSGRPGRTALSVLTGRYRRVELDSICGPPDEQDRYLVPPERIAALPRRGLYSHLCNTYDDIALATLAAWALYWRSYDPNLAHWLAMACLGWMLLTLVAALSIAWVLLTEELADEQD